MTLEEKLGKILLENKLTVATAESCTGGLLSSRLTDVSGSSEYVKLNFVTYANEAKHKILGVSWDTLNTCGAVSEQCAEEWQTGFMTLQVQMLRFVLQELQVQQAELPKNLSDLFIFQSDTKIL